MRSPSRARAAVVLGSSLVLGLALQPFREHAWTDAVGTVAYAAAAVGVVGVLWPRRGALLPGVVGTGLAWVVELFQLTGIPARVAEHAPAAALVLGGRFDPADLLWLGVGGLVATLALGRRPSTGDRGALGGARRPVAE